MFFLFKLYDRFNKICDTKIESESEFLHLCGLVQDNGLIDVKKAKEVRNYKVRFNYVIEILIQKNIKFIKTYR